MEWRSANRRDHKTVGAGCDATSEGSDRMHERRADFDNAMA